MVIQFLVAFALFYTWHIMGVTIGYHRLLSHKAFKCPKFVEYFWVLGGYLAFQGSPIWWAAMHRAHHRYTDLPLDPHTPLLSGWRYAYYGWIKEPDYPAHIVPETQCRDLFKDPLYTWLEQDGQWRKAHKVCAIINLAFRFLLLCTFGWVVAIADFIAAVVVQQVPLLLNVLCHIPKLGYKNYETEDDSVNVWWVALLAAGEGWHNNHHAFPGSARSGMKWTEVDLSWMTIRVMKLFGLVQYMNERTKHSVYKPVGYKHDEYAAFNEASIEQLQHDQPEHKQVVKTG
jgi:fatty-acid desaturase